MSRALIIGYDSELARSIGSHLEENDWLVFGTSRRQDAISDSVFFLDARDSISISSAMKLFMETAHDWDLLVLAIGSLNPVGRITNIDFEEWKESFEVNFVNQLLIIKTMIELSSSLSLKNRRILTFAGSGTNSAPKNFSAYTLSKIALIKATELLAAENPEYTFISLGTGWMKSPIHRQTINAGLLAGDAYFETLRRIENDHFGDPSQLMKFIDWFLECKDRRISGRNISLQGDDWEDPYFIESLVSSDDRFKLRRSK
jgi:NAD(P)-dependent dehydrogenase (short-subunit alcohol dehydrogenase family)